MALLMIEGFEARAFKAGWASGQTIATVAGRFGGYALKSGGGGSYASYTCPASVTVISGLAYRCDNATTWGGNYAQIVTFKDPSGITHMDAFVNVTGRIELRRNGTVVATSSLALNPSVWYYVEIKVTIADAGGFMEVRVNGTSWITFTGDTRNAGTASVGMVMYTFSNDQYTDDVYLLDDTGSAPYNTYLGDVKVDTLSPNNNGNSSQLVGSDGNSTDNYQLVDELPALIADYTGSSTIGEKDTYAFSNLATATGTALAVQTSVFGYKSDAGVANIKTVERLAGGTERDSVSMPMAASPGSWLTGGPQVTDPASAPWTITSINAAEFGVKVD